MRSSPPKPRRTYQACILAFAAGMAALVACSSAGTSVWYAVGAYVLAFGGYAGVLLRIYRDPTIASTQAIFAIGIAARIAILVAGNPKYLSDDIHRYVFEGHVVRDGGSPYHFAPASPMWDDLVERENLHELRARVNHDSIATVYPPAAQVLFASSTWMAGSTLPWRLIVSLLDLGAAACLVLLLRNRGRPTTWVAVYLLSPLVLVEATLSGHVDAPAVALLTCAILLFLRGRNRWAWAVAVTATMVKPTCLVVLPLFVRQGGWKIPLALLLIATAAFATWPSWCPFPDPPATPDGNWKSPRGGNLVAARGELSLNGRRVSRRVVARGIEELREDDGTLRASMVRSASQRVLATWDDDGVDIHFRDAAPTPLPRPGWERVLGDYHLFASAVEDVFDNGAIANFDGSGRVVVRSRDGRDAIHGFYWLEEDGQFAMQTGSRYWSFRATDDISVLAPGTGGTGLWALAFAETPGMGARQYAARWSANGPIFRAIMENFRKPDLLEVETRGQVRLGLALLLLFVVGALALLRISVATAVLSTFAFLWLLSPVVYPWYLIWLLPFATLRPSPGVIAWTGSIFLCYPVVTWPTSEWTPWLEWLQLVIPAAVLAMTWKRRRGRPDVEFADSPGGG